MRNFVSVRFDPHGLDELGPDMMNAGLPRVLFGWKPEWRNGCEASCGRAGFSAAMQEFDDADLDAFDAIVPLTLRDQAIIDQREGTVRALTTAPALRHIFHDKLGFARLMSESGLGEHVPRVLEPNSLKPSDFPLVVKARHGEFGHGTHIARSPAELDAHRSALTGGTAFLQELIPGDEEFAVHILLGGGMMLFSSTIRYRMPGLNLVNGFEQKPVARSWLGTEPFKPLWYSVLSRLGMTSGTVCIDYRLRGGRPVIFEINPRVGGSLTGRMEDYLHVYMSCFGAGPRLAIG